MLSAAVLFRAFRVKDKQRTVTQDSLSQFLLSQTSRDLGVICRLKK